MCPVPPTGGAVGRGCVRCDGQVGASKATAHDAGALPPCRGCGGGWCAAVEQASSVAVRPSSSDFARGLKGSGSWQTGCVWLVQGRQCRAPGPPLLCPKSVSGSAALTELCHALLVFVDHCSTSIAVSIGFSGSLTVLQHCPAAVVCPGPALDCPIVCSVRFPVSCCAPSPLDSQAISQGARSRGARHSRILLLWPLCLIVHPP